MKVGNTQLVKLEKIMAYYHLDSEIYAKVESSNPSGSIKDRAAYLMLKKYKEEGLLKDGGTVIEATSGNMGISLAYFQKEFNYQAIIVMPSSMSINRRKMILEYNAKLVLVDGGMAECNKEALALKDKIEGAILFKQFDNYNNSLAHYLSTAPEIDNELSNIDYLFAGIGTGGTISGIGRYYKEKGYQTKIVGIEPDESPLLTKGVAHSHLIQGIGANFVPKILDLGVIDKVITCKGEKAIQTAYLIRDLERLDIGYSSGACLAACVAFLQENKIKNKKAVVIFPDRGNRYQW